VVFCMFSELRWKVIVCFVDIDGIVHHCCLNFLFIKSYYIFHQGNILCRWYFFLQFVGN
jgi:hypothetical protein